jgi:hypothetical protein
VSRTAARLYARVGVLASDHRVLWALLAGALVLLPGIVAVAGAPKDWYPTGDVSHTELMLRSIPGDFPLIGVAARVGNDINNQGSTPGASMAYVLYPVYLLLFRSSYGVLVSVLIVHLAAVAALLVLARRFGGGALAVITAGGIAVMVRSLAPRFFLEPWNVWVPVFSYFVFVILLWGLALGRHRGLPWAVLIGTHCVQTHVSYVPIVVVPLVVLGAYSWWDARRDGGGMRRSIGWSVIVGALMWLPPVIEQLRPGPGNLRRLWEEFGTSHADNVGLRAAVKAMVGELNLAGPVITGPGKAPYDAPNIPGFVGFAILMAAGLVVAWRRRDRDVLSLQAVLSLVTLVGLVATSRIFGRFYDYVIRWMWVLAVMWLVVSLWALWRRLADRPTPPSMIARVFVTGVAAITVWGAVASVGAEPPYGNDSKLVAGLADQLDERLDSGSDYLLRWHDPAALGGTGFGLLLEMEKRGDHVFVDQWAGAAARPHRVRDELQPGAVDVVLWLVTGQENIDRFGIRDDAVELAYYDPRSADEVVESDRLRLAIEDRMLALGHPEWIELLDSQYGHMQILLFTPIPDDLFTDVARYSEIRVPGAVFEVPVGAPLYP